MQLLQSNNTSIQRHGLTAQQIADIVHVSERSVRKRKGIDRFLIGHVQNGPGRPVTVYDQNALSLWPGYTAPETIVKQSSRKGRSDCGVPRKCTAEQWGAIVDHVKALYLNNAQKNLKLACEEAERQLKVDGMEVPVNVYKRLSKDTTDHAGDFISEYRRHQWENVHDSIWRKKDLAIAMPTVRYDYLSIFESAGWAGDGFGALRAWSIDVRKNDVWTEDWNGQYSMPSGIYIRDALTGYPLWMEPITGSSESSNELIHAYISCAIAWGRFPDIAVAIDNGKAMISNRTTGVIAASLPPEAWERADAYPEIFGRKGECSPILQNLPNIPQAAFKAALERSFKLMKDEFDATRFPQHYQGGARKEAVQLNLSAQPVYPVNMLQAGDYYKALASWMWNDFVHRPRPRADSLTLFRERGWECTIAAAFAYYGGQPKQDGQLPDGERLARLLYFATEKPHVVKAQIGYVDTMIKGRFGHWILGDVEAYYGRKIAVIPVPGMEQERAVLLLADNRREPKYIGIAFNGFVRHINGIAPAKEARNEAQATIRDRLKEERETVKDVRWRDHGTQTLPPATTTQIAGTLHVVEEATVIDVEDDYPATATDPDINDLLNDVEELL